MLDSHFQVSGIPETWKSPNLLNPTNDWNESKRLNEWDGLQY